MRKTLIIARKELLSTFRQRNLMLLMFLSPIVLVTIMGLAFSGLGGGNAAPDFADISVAVVNLDEGVNLQERLPVSVTGNSLLGLAWEIGGQTLNLGESLQQNQNLDLSSSVLDPGNISFNYGEQLAAILLSQPLTATSPIASDGINFDLDELSCPLLPATGSDVESSAGSNADENGNGGSVGSLDDLFDAVAVNDPEAARVGVERGDYAAAVIIPPDFSRHLAPHFGLNTTLNATETTSATGEVEVFANNGTPISASIVRAVVEGIVGQYERMNVAADALVVTTIDTVIGLNSTGPDSNAIESSLFNAGLISSTLQTVDASVLEPLACLILPGASNIQIAQQPLDTVQERSTFSILMVVLGGAQAVFFALFTGVFGINAIYEDRQQGTLQRVLVSPTSSTSVLTGRLLGNLLIVMTQLGVLLLAFTAIASLVERDPIFIWGSNLPALLLVLLGLSLFTTGLGVLIVGLAPTSEQVQMIGPLITLLLGTLGGALGTLVPRQLSQFSPIWWGVEAMRKLASSEYDIGLHLLVLFGVGLLFASVGTYFFRRRMRL